ncbi:OmpA family protein [Putridiphycobacter roseus]|nr:OmpA family protein [Putridiphycobacter roseus]
MKNYILVSLFICFAFQILGQEENAATLKKAESLYEDYSFDKAISKYSEAQDGSPEVLRRLAESFYKIGNIEKAEVLYGKLANGEGTIPSDVYMYAAALMQNKKYTEARAAMVQYNTLNPDDSRGQAYLSNEDLIKELQKNKGQFAIKNLAINSPQEDFSPAYFKSKLVFTSSREGVVPIRRKWNWNKLPFLDVYVADIDAEGELSELKQLNKVMNKKYHEGPICYNKRENMMAYTRNNYQGKSKEGVVKLQIYITRKLSGDWEEPWSFPLNSNEYSVGHPAFSTDSKWLYFASDMPGGFGGVDLYKISMGTDSTFGEAINLGADINTEGDEMFPTIHQDGILAYASNGHPGLGGLDVFVVQLKEDGALGKMYNLGSPVNSNRDDFSFILNKNMKSGYFASNRLDGKGDDDLYYFDLLKPITFGKEIKGTVKSKTGELLANTTVKLLDEEGNTIDSVVTDESGAYSFNVDADKKFALSGQKEKYFEAENVVDTDTEEAVIVADIALEKDPGLSLYALVTDKKENTPLADVDMKIVDNITGEEILFKTGETGDYKKPLADKKIDERGSYNITLEKEGYLTKTVTYNVLFEKPGIYNVHESLDLAMDKLEVGGDISKLIEINPIYFDFNKFNIREDAALELDKIVTVMNQYPGMEIELGSHTDSRGSASYNMRLSDKRAKASAKYIKKHITNPDRITGKGYGETKLINQCSDGVKCSDEEHQENRRTEFIIIKLDEKVKANNSSPNSL